MQIYISYLKGTLSSPQKTFQEILKDKKSSQIIGIYLASYIIYKMVEYSLISKQISSFYFFPSILQTAPSTLYIYLSLLSPVIFAAYIGIQHIILHTFFSQKGTFLQLLTINSLFSTIIFIFDIFVIYTTIHIPQTQIFFLITTLWSIYLTITAYSIIYKISKKKALAAYLVQLFPLIALGFAFSIIAF